MIEQDNRRSEVGELTPQHLLRLEYLSVPPDLQPYVTTFYLFRCDEPVIRDVQPAATAQLQIYLTGHGRMDYPDGRSEPSHPETIMAPLTAAARFEVEGPFHALGAALGALGWAALTGLDASEAADKLFDATGLFGTAARNLGDDIRAAYRAAPDADPDRLVEMLAQFIRARLRPIPVRHARLVARTAEWLGSGFNPSLEELYDGSGYSSRQVQRLVARYFGSTPAHLARKYRATRVMALLSDSGLSDEAAAALTDAFYDQSHMIREMREFVGRTPTRMGDGDTPILEALVDVRNFREIKPAVAPMPKLESWTEGD